MIKCGHGRVATVELSKNMCAGSEGYKDGSQQEVQVEHRILHHHAANTTINANQSYI